MKKLLLLLTVSALTISSCKKENSQAYKVEYSIACTDCEVIYVSDQAGTQATEFHQNSSWKYSFNAKKGQQVLLLAYNTSSTPQGVTATIKLNGNTLQTQTNYCPVSGDAFVVDTIQ